MMKKLIAGVALCGLCGCVSEAQINADLSRHIGESETDLVREMGVPARHYDSGGHHFLAYISVHQEILSSGPGPGPAAWGGGGWGGGWGWGGWGWGGWGWGGWGFSSSDVETYSCQTSFEIVGGRVVGFTRHGNAC